MGLHGMVLNQSHFTANLPFIHHQSRRRVQDHESLGANSDKLGIIFHKVSSCKVAWKPSISHLNTVSPYFTFLPVHAFANSTDRQRCLLVPTNCQTLLIETCISFYSSICLQFISNVHVSGFVFSCCTTKLVWDSLGSHLSSMQCNVFIKFKTARTHPRREGERKTTSNYCGPPHMSMESSPSLFLSVCQTLC